MPAREVVCKVTQKLWLTPTVLSLRLEPSKKFSFEPGQFLSIIVPPTFLTSIEERRVRRIYSIACAQEQGYELCIKMTGGPGPSYLASLNVGDTFRASAPYGDFFYRPKAGRSACFISTGTGIAPFRAMILSTYFRENPPEETYSLFGARTEDEILFADELDFLGVKVINALSDAKPKGNHFHGRVTDYLNQLSSDWNWHGTDFYLCGNGEMVKEVCKILKHSRGVADSAIFKEVYFGAGKSANVAPDNRAVAA